MSIASIPIPVSEAIARLDPRDGRIKSYIGTATAEWDPITAEAFLRRASTIVEAPAAMRTDGFTIAAYGPLAAGNAPLTGRWVVFAATEMPNPANSASRRLDSRHVETIVADVFVFPGRWSSLVWGGNDETPSPGERADLVIDILEAARQAGILALLERQGAVVDGPAHDHYASAEAAD